MRTIAVVIEDAVCARKGVAGQGFPSTSSGTGLKRLRSIVPDCELWLVSADPHRRAVAQALGATLVQPPKLDERLHSGIVQAVELIRALEKLSGLQVQPDDTIFVIRSGFGAPTTSAIKEALAAVTESVMSPGPAKIAIGVRREEGGCWTLRGEEGTDPVIPPTRTLEETSPQPRLVETGTLFCFRGSALSTERAMLVQAPVALIEKTAQEEAVTRRSIRALVTDFDGVHTDDRVLVQQDGQEGVLCNRGDGMGISLLRDCGTLLFILSREENPVVRARAAKLKMEVQHDILTKLPALDAWRQAKGLEWSEIAFIGNDINDVECLEAAGLSFAPADAHATALTAADIILTRNGGHGALRELADYLIAADLLARGK